MARLIVRQMKRAVTAGSRIDAHPGAQALAKECALSLLSRSIGFGHARLAVIRLSIAVHAGAEIPHSHWLYCRNAAALSRDSGLRGLFLQATNAAPPHVIHALTADDHEKSKEAA